MLKFHKSGDGEIVVSSFLCISALLSLWFSCVFNVQKPRIVGPFPSPSSHLKTFKHDKYRKKT